jgi:hypothetical protein
MLAALSEQLDIVGTDDPHENRKPVFKPNLLAVLGVISQHRDLLGR